MRYFKWTIISYIIQAIKLIGTVLFLGGNFSNLYCFTIISLLSSLGYAYYEEYFFICLLSLVFVAIVWFGGILLSLFGSAFKLKARKWSVILFFIANIIDLMASFTVQTMHIRIGCVLISCIGATIGFAAIREIRERKYQSADGSLSSDEK